MAEHPAEVTGITASAGALMLNLGNITDARIESMKRSMRTAMEKPVCIFMMYWTGRNQMERFTTAVDSILLRAVIPQARMTRQRTIQRISQMSQKKIL